ncbi:MAG: hypothetical protein P8K68_07275 [Algibacter sp.]|uniref:hypothetical protein n=1 Tax=Algibacter sp. TaxID=1872428 RepID=UPI002617BF7F|nr:hypothetical protein [Algibacter sp.]MDG1729604.1 hypothetical protein [Algibacter sp.]MDG2178575.1 hypothetical protein [Algibacter sp.]
MITLTFNEHLDLLKTKFKADIYAKDILDYIIAFKNNTTYPRKLKGIIDARDSSFKFSFRDLKSFNDAKTESLKSYDIVIFAILINSPATAAISTLYEAIANNEKYKFKVFSTEEAALIWVKGF